MEDTPDVVDTLTGHVNQSAKRIKLLADQYETIGILKGHVKEYDPVGIAIISSLNSTTQLLGESLGIEPSWVEKELDRRKEARKTQKISNSEIKGYKRAPRK